MFDCGLDLPGRPPLEHACQQAGIATGPGGSRSCADLAAGCPAATLAVQRALMIALVCARHQGRYEWAGALRVGQVLAAAAWGCLGADRPGTLASQVTRGHAAAEPPVACGNLK